MANKSVLLLQIFLISFIVAGVNSVKVLRPVIKDSTFWEDKSRLKQSVQINNDDPHINITVDVLQDIPDVDVHVEGSVVQKSDPNYTVSFKATVNLCEILKWRAKSLVGNLVYGHLKSFGVLPESCPIKKGKYYITKFWVPEEEARGALPEFKFELTLQINAVDASKKRTLILNDRFGGDGVVKEVAKINSGLLAGLG